MIQIYLVFIPSNKCMKYFSGTTGIESRKSNGISKKHMENIENITKSDRKFSPTFVDHHLLPDIHFNGYYLIKNNIFSLKR